jgi:hypothetical protein
VGVVEVLRRGPIGFVVRIHFESVSEDDFEPGELRELAARYPRQWPLSYRFAVQCSALSSVVDVALRSIQASDEAEQDGGADTSRRLERGCERVIVSG